jgi:hypothetical protein
VKLNNSRLVPHDYDQARFVQILLGIDNQVNSLAEGRMPARYYSGSETPNNTMLSAGIGDIVWNSNATVQGTVTAQYVLIGWVCTAPGAPGVWRDMRVLTGT